MNLSINKNISFISFSPEQNFSIFLIYVYIYVRTLVRMYVCVCIFIYCLLLSFEFRTLRNLLCNSTCLYYKTFQKLPLDPCIKANISTVIPSSASWHSMKAVSNMQNSSRLLANVCKRNISLSSRQFNITKYSCREIHRS